MEPGKLPVPGVLLIGHGPTALAEGACGVCLDSFSLKSLSVLFSLSLSLGDCQI